MSESPSVSQVYSLLCGLLAKFRVVLIYLSICARKGDEIYHQLRRLGASLDWSRACFTMDQVRHQTIILIAAIQGANQLIKGNRGFSILLKDTLIQSIGELGIEPVTFDC